MEWNVVLSQFLQLILVAVITATVPYLARLLAIYLQKKVAEAESSMSDDQRYAVKEIVRTVVYAAQQSGIVAKAKAEVFNKKEWALTQAEIILRSKGIVLDLHELDVLIEAEVLKSFHPEAIPARNSAFND